jgi:hypothetical protein
MSYVYLLKHADLPLVKIGLSKAPLSRSKQIGSEAFNMASSCIVKTANEACARRLERALHLLHDGDRQRDSRVPFSGATEWFSSFVYDQALTFIKREGSAFNVLGIESAVGEQEPRTARRAILRGEEWKAKRRHTESMHETARSRAYWLLWQFFNEVALKLAQVENGAAVVDGQLWLVTNTGPILFKANGLDFPEIFVHYKHKSARERPLTTVVDRAHIPHWINLSCPRIGLRVRLLLDEHVEDDATGFFLLADLNKASAEEQLYVKALALHIPAIRNALGDALPAIEQPPEVGPTGDLEWVCW